jgi:hypothetical protein
MQDQECKVQTELSASHVRGAGLRWFDWLLMVGFVVVLCTGVWCVLSSPPLWAWCLTQFDARGWTHWTWTGVVLTLLAVLAAIRFAGNRNLNRSLLAQQRTEQIL